MTLFSSLNGLFLLRCLRLLPLLDGVRLLGVRLPLECEDRDDSKDRRLLVRVLRRMPLRLLFFNSGGRGGFPGEMARDEELKGDAHAAGVDVGSVHIRFQFGVCNGDEPAKFRLRVEGLSQGSSDGL